MIQLTFVIYLSLNLSLQHFKNWLSIELSEEWGYVEELECSRLESRPTDDCKTRSYHLNRWPSAGILLQFGLEQTNCLTGSKISSNQLAASSTLPSTRGKSQHKISTQPRNGKAKGKKKAQREWVSEKKIELEQENIRNLKKKKAKAQSRKKVKV
jgi:hypothetical protein